MELFLIEKITFFVVVFRGLKYTPTDFDLNTQNKEKKISNISQINKVRKNLKMVISDIDNTLNIDDDLQNKYSNELYDLAVTIPKLLDELYRRAEDKNASSLMGLEPE